MVARRDAGLAQAGHSAPSYASLSQGRLIAARCSARFTFAGDDGTLLRRSSADRAGSASPSSWWPRAETQRSRRGSRGSGRALSVVFHSCCAPACRVLHARAPGRRRRPRGRARRARLPFSEATRLSVAVRVLIVLGWHLYLYDDPWAGATAEESSMGGAAIVRRALNESPQNLFAMPVVFGAVVLTLLSIACAVVREALRIADRAPVALTVGRMPRGAAAPPPWPSPPRRRRDARRRAPQRRRRCRRAYQSRSQPRRDLLGAAAAQRAAVHARAAMLIGDDRRRLRPRLRAVGARSARARARASGGGAAAAFVALLLVFSAVYANAAPSSSSCCSRCTTWSSAARRCGWRRGC